MRASRYCDQSLRLRVAAQNRFRRRAEPLARSLARLNRERSVPGINSGGYGAAAVKHRSIPKKAEDRS